MFKKSLSLVLVFVFVFASFSVVSYADETPFTHTFDISDIEKPVAKQSPTYSDIEIDSPFYEIYDQVWVETTSSRFGLVSTREVGENFSYEAKVEYWIILKAKPLGFVPAKETVEVIAPEWSEATLEYNFELDYNYNFLDIPMDELMLIIKLTDTTEKPPVMEQIKIEIDYYMTISSGFPGIIFRLPDLLKSIIRILVENM